MIKPAIERSRLLLVSRDSAVLRPVWPIGESTHWQLESAANAWEAMEIVQSGVTPDLLLLDLPPGDGDGLHILRWLRRLRPAMPIILIGQSEDVAKKQEAIRLGARDYLVRPVDERQLEMVIRQHGSTAREAIETDITSDHVEPLNDGSFFIGTNPIMRKLRAQAALLAEANVPVLILGEVGSGKETTARLLHKLSVRSGFEFATVNCAALPSDLLARELFGYERDGSGPVQTKAGKLELCAKGTILLDEITEMPMDVQAKLLHVLQNKQFVRPGTSASIEVDVRIVAASSSNMEHAISQNRLREDLYYCLSGYTIHVPPLRKRKEDIPLLAWHFMQQLAKRYDIAPRSFSPAILEACKTYSWPGNLRELENFMKRYLVAGEQELAFQKTRSDLTEVTQSAPLPLPRSMKPLMPSLVQSNAGMNGPNSLRSLIHSVKSQAERNAIAAALEKTGWNRKAAARLLKISYRTLLNKIEQYQMR